MRNPKTALRWLSYVATGALLGCAPPLNVSPTDLPKGAEGLYYIAMLTSDAATASAWGVVSGGLPPGLRLDAASGVLDGTPTASGTFTFAVSVSDASFPPRSGEKSYTITIIPRLTLGATLPTARVNEPYSAAFSAGGGVPPYTFSVVGLPAGLALDAVTGTISGTPLTPTLALRLDATVTDVGDPRQSATETTFLVIKPLAVTITTTSLPAGKVNQSYRQQLAADEGLPPYSWAVVSGVLPHGLSLSLSTGVIAGTPTVAETATFGIRVTDSDSPSTTETKTFTIEIKP